MNAAAPTPDLTRLSTGEVRLLDVLRWLVLLLHVHCLIARARRLATALRDGVDAPDDDFLAVHFGTSDRSQVLARVTRALGRAVALQAKLLAFRPVENGFPIEDRRAVAAVVNDICTELGIFRSKPARTTVVARRTARSGGFETRPCNAANQLLPPSRRLLSLRAPPRGPRVRGGTIPIVRSHRHAGVPWSISGAPARA